MFHCCCFNLSDKNYIVLNFFWSDNKVNHNPKKLNFQSLDLLLRTREG